MRRLPRFLATFLALATLSFALLVADGARAPSVAQNAKLDAALSNGWWGHVPIMVAVDKGFFKDLGIDVEVKANIDDSPGNEGCWARPGISSFKDLKGRKVAANTSAQITMNGLLENEGMAEKDVQFVNLPGGEMAGAIARGDVDAACVWEPLFTNVKNAAPGGKLLGLDSDTPNFKKFGTMASPDIMIISRKLVDENPDLAKKVATAIFKGVKYANENPEDTAKAVAHYFRQEPEVVLAAMKQFKYFGAANWPDHMKLHTGQMEFLSKWLVDNGKISKMPDVKAWENLSFIPK